MNFKICIYFLLFLLFLISPKKISNKQKKIINISFTINDQYMHDFFIPLVSLLKNSDKNTVYHIYILVGEYFPPKKYKTIYNLEKIYLNCFIYIINLGKSFEGTYTRKFSHISTYYRLKLPQICNDLNRIIYMDTDTVILNDLTELYTLNFEGKYILGKLDKYTNELDKFKLYINNYINCGVLLMDLYSLRLYRYADKFMDYIINHNNEYYLPSQDQTVINYICHDKIGILKPVYHMWPYSNKQKCLEDNKKLKIPYDLIDINKAFDSPFIIHFPGEFKYRESYINQPFYKTLYKYIIYSVKIRLKLKKWNK